MNLLITMSNKIMLDKIRIILVNTSHPGNIGASARAMKTMGLSKLYLVQPKKYPDGLATAMASNADDILAQAVVVDSLDEALQGCGLIFGTSARKRTLQIPLLDPRQTIETITSEYDGQDVALIFGREQTGLNNEELMRCHYHLNIPSNPDYSSLNLASAVQVVSYECRVGLLDAQPLKPIYQDRYATATEVQLFYDHLTEILTETRLLNPSAPKRIMPRLQRMFGRIRLEAREVRLLRGVLRSINFAVQKPDGKTENT